MSVDRDAVRRAARLARIAVPEDELDPLAKELSGILGFVEQLDEVDVDGVPAMTSVVVHSLQRRADEITDGDRPAEVVANAPEGVDGFFTAPKVVE